MWEICAGLGLVCFSIYNFYSAYSGTAMTVGSAFKNLFTLLGGLFFVVTSLLPDKKKVEKQVQEKENVDENKPVEVKPEQVEVNVPEIVVIENKEEIIVGTEVKNQYTAEEIEMKDFACLVHLRERLKEAGNDEGLKLCAELNKIFFDLKASKPKPTV